MVNKFFGLSERQTNVRTEFIAGATTFLTMAYIIFVNPAILSTTGMDKQALIATTCIVSALATLITGIFGKAPIAMAPGMGLNAFFAYTLVLNNKVNWETALGVVFLSGLFFLITDIIRPAEKISGGNTGEFDFSDSGRNRLIYYIHRTGQIRRGGK